MNKNDVNPLVNDYKPIYLTDRASLLVLRMMNFMEEIDYHIDAEERSGYCGDADATELLDLIFKMQNGDNVKRGLWLENTPQLFTCSECGAVKIDPSNFCPHCGAKMDGVGE